MWYLERAISLCCYQTFNLCLIGLVWIGLDWIGLGLFVWLELHRRDRGKHHLYHPYNAHHLNQYHPHLPTLDPFHSHPHCDPHKTIHQWNIHQVIYLPHYADLKNFQTLINTRFVVLKYIYSVTTLVIFHYVKNLVTENDFNMNASLLT